MRLFIFCVVSFVSLLSLISTNNYLFNHFHNAFDIQFIFMIVIFLIHVLMFINIKEHSEKYQEYVD